MPIYGCAHTGEPGAANASKSFHDLGSCCDHLAISIQEQVKDEMQKSVFVLEEWLRLVEGVKEALRVQAGAAGLYFALLTECDKRERALQKGAQAGGKPVTEADVSEAKRKAEEARQRAELLGQRLRQEMVRFKQACRTARLACYTYGRTCVCVCVCVCLCVCVCVCVCVCINIYIYIDIQTYIHTYIRCDSSKPSLWSCARCCSASWKFRSRAGLS